MTGTGTGTRPLTQVVSKSITAGEALLAATLGIILYNRIEWKNAWTMVRGTLVCREGGGNKGKKSTSTWTPKNDNEEVLNMKNEGCGPRVLQEQTGSTGKKVQPQVIKHVEGSWSGVAWEGLFIVTTLVEKTMLVNQQ